MNLPNFDAAFQDGRVFRGASRELIARVSSLGNVDLPTGFIEVVDPLLYSEDPDEESEPSGTPDITPGSYPAQLSKGEFPIAVRVVFDDAPAIRFEHFHDVSVDSATIAVLDATALKALVELGEAALLEEVQNVVLPDGGILRLDHGNAVVFATGADGGYPCFWGIGERGQKVSLIVDIGTLYDEIEIGLRVPRKELVRGANLSSADLAPLGISLEIVEIRATELVLKVDGYDSATAFQLRMPDDQPLYQSKLFHRDKKLLTLSFPKGLPDDAHLFIGLRSELRAMEATDELRVV